MVTNSHAASYQSITRGGDRRTTTGGVAAAEAYRMQASYHSGRENAMTTTITRGSQRTPTTGTHADATGSPGTSGVVAGLLMVTGIGWNAGLEARPFQPAMMGVTALVIHILPLAALMVFLVPALARHSGDAASRSRRSSRLPSASSRLCSASLIRTPGWESMTSTMPCRSRSWPPARCCGWCADGGSAPARSTARRHDVRQRARFRPPGRAMPGWQDAPPPSRPRDRS